MPAEPPQWIKDHCHTIGERIRTRRLRANHTQEQIADEAGLSWSTVQRIEAGSTTTRISYYLAIARALDVDPGELFTDLG